MPRTHVRHCVRACSLVFVAMLSAVTLGVQGAAPATIGSDAPQWPPHPDWQRFVMAPTAPDVHPVRIVSTAGSVNEAATLVGSGVGRATLTMTPGGRSPAIVLDYGQDVSGIPYFVVQSESGTPLLHSAYSEGPQYLGPQGDQAPPNSPTGDPNRFDDLIVDRSGSLTTGTIQGGERYERISLTSPGRVTLTSTGIRFTAVRATAKDYRGWFDSSSPELNRIWYDGAYTTQLDELPPDAAPSAWTIEAEALHAVTGTVGILRQGAGWTNYTMSFDARVVDNQAGWLVRAPSTSSGYLLVLHHADSGTGTSNSLIEIALGPTEFATIGHVVLPKSFDAAAWHHVTTQVSGSTITTSLDGRRVASFDTKALPAGTSVYGTGSVGFAELGSSAVFRDLEVTSLTGATLYASSLSDQSALSDFSGSDIVTSDPLPVIMDGAKRDRVVWSGDLGVETPNVLYTTGADDYVRDSLQLLGSYQVADGETGTNVNPTAPLATFPQSGSTYSTSYSMDEVDNIATYYLYTGDLAFVRAEWPVITRELAYNASLVDGRGLLVTNSDDGQDWDYYNGSHAGAVTYYNDIYFETLTNAALMADALGRPDQAASYRQEAANLRTAINRYLFDPSTGLYELSDQQPSAEAQDGNSLAVLFGVAPTGQDAATLAALAKALPSTPYGPQAFTANAGLQNGVSPFVTNDEVRALFASGDTASALSLLQRLWGYMDAPGPDYTGADWELVGPNGAPGFGDGTSLAHGWSSGATADLSSYVLGVQPTAAGFDIWSVNPHPGSLSWAEGNVPTPHGTIEVRWAQQPSSGRFALQVTAPGRTTGTLTVPVSRTGAVVTVVTTKAPSGRRSEKAITVAPGATSLPVPVVGGATYDVYVAP
ncbi:MAG TPA: alpha-L-rhamnosidase C-terminal domain-containing protein [Acidimicrobiales bacterium]